MRMPELVSARLILESLAPAHARECHAGLADAEVYRYLDEEPPADPEALEARFQRLAAGAPAGRGEHWLNWIARRWPDRAAIGWLQATVHADGSAHVAYVLMRSAWGHGFAREGLAAVIGYLGEVHGVRWLLASVDPRNRRSIAVLEALGFEPVEAPGRATAEAVPGDVTYRRERGPSPVWDAGADGAGR